MIKKRAIFSVLSICVMLLFCGCGTPMYELTEDEEELIVQYSAYAVGQFNIYQKDGMKYYNQQTEEDETVSEASEPDTETAGSNSQGTSSTAADTSSGSAISFAEAIGYGNELSVSYKGFELSDNYKEGNYFSIDAKTGYQLLIAKFELKNTSGQGVDVNVMEQNPTFRLSIDGSKNWVSEDETLLLYDLSTYYGTIAAGDSVDCVLLFQIPSDKSVDNGDVSFSVVRSGTTYSLN